MQALEIGLIGEQLGAAENRVSASAWIAFLGIFASDDDSANPPLKVRNTLGMGSRGAGARRKLRFAPKNWGHIMFGQRRAQKG